MHIIRKLVTRKQPGLISSTRSVILISIHFIKTLKQQKNVLTHKCFSDTSLLSLDGICPVKSLFLKSKTSKFSKLPYSFGIPPEKWFLESILQEQERAVLVQKHRKSGLESSKRSCKRDPYRVFKLLNWLSSGANVPSKEHPLRSLQKQIEINKKTIYQNIETLMIILIFS